MPILVADCHFGMLAAPISTNLRPAALGLGVLAAGLLLGVASAWNPLAGVAGVAAGTYALLALQSVQTALVLSVPSFFVPFLTAGNLWLKGGLLAAAVAATLALAADRGHEEQQARQRAQFARDAEEQVRWKPKPAAILSAGATPPHKIKSRARPASLRPMPTGRSRRRPKVTS